MIMVDIGRLLSSLVQSTPRFSPSFALVTDWMIAGVVLLLVGWATLPRAPRRGPVRSTPGGAIPRIIGGATLASAVTFAVCVAGAFLQSPTSPFATWAALPRVTVEDAVLGSLALGAIGGWLSRTSRWSASGVVTWLGLATLSMGFVGYAGLVVSDARDGFAVAVGLALVALESLGLFLMLAYQFYALEHIAGASGNGGGLPSPGGRTPESLPTVAFQVASYNESVEVVERSLDSLLAVNYPKEKRLIQLLDDSQDPDFVEELSRFCRLRGVQYLHRAHRRGYKAGALNDGLLALGPEVELLAVVDSDYVIDPAFLQAVVGAFDDPKVGYLQTPQSYRNIAGSPFGESYALADAYFYHVVQPVRARSGSAIFCGTMGLLRRSALASVGGWSEECVTEDAEVSIRLIAAGWRGVYSEQRFGQGLAPMNMAGVRTQHRRWALGGLQMLRMNRARIASGGMTRRQWTDFWIGGMFWTDGLFFLGMAGTLVLVAVGLALGFALPSPSMTALALAASAPVLLLWDGLLKIRLALRPSHAPSYRDVLGILAFWYAVKLNDLRAALRGLFGFRTTFGRTPKSPEMPLGVWASVRSTVRATRLEVLLASTLFGVSAIVLYRGAGGGLGSNSFATLVLAGWLTYYATALLAAPILDYRSRRRPASVAEETRASRPRPPGTRAAEGGPPGPRPG